MTQTAPATAPKDRILLQIKSLDPKDDERKTISKIVSWILRRGAATVGVSQDQRTRWVKFEDMCASEVLKDHSPDLIWEVIVEFNAKKPRYEISDDAGGRFLRAHKKDEVYNQGADPAGAAAEVPQPQSQNAQQAQQAQLQAAYAAAAQNPQMYPWNYWHPMMMPFMNPYMWQQAAAVSQGKLQGRIKSINSEKGFGFIECQETYDQYNRDVFLHKAQIKDLQTGSYVQFSCELNKQGMPQARDVRPLGEPMTLLQSAAPFTDGSKGWTKGKDGGKGKASGKGRGKGKKGKGEGGKGAKNDGKNGKGNKETSSKEDASAHDEQTEIGAGGSAADAKVDAAAAPVEAAPRDPPCDA
jgi:cold shock CspA family protein